MRVSSLSRTIRALGTALAVCLAGPALAHPHVMVTARSDFIIGTDGKLTGIRHAWTFDEAYSAFAVTGMKTGADGKVAKGDLEDLSKLNVESLSEFAYFTTLKKGKSKLAFDNPQPGYYLEHDGSALTLHFILPLKTPIAPGAATTLKVDDETFFVAFSMADKEPSRIEGNAPSCKVDVKRPQKPTGSGDMAKLGEDFFNNLKTGFTEEFATTIHLSCP